jgi:hypothetical protein
MGRRAGDVFVIGEESLLVGHEDEPRSDGLPDSEDDWVPFEGEPPIDEGRRSGPGGSVWLRRVLVTAAALVAVAAVISRVIVSGTAAVASDGPRQEVGSPLVLGAPGARPRAPRAPRRRTATRPRRRSMHPRRRSATHPRAGHAGDGSAPPRRGGKSASRHSFHPGSEEGETGAVEEREPPVEEAPESAPVEPSSTEPVVVETAPEPAPAAEVESNPQPSASPAQDGAGSSGADSFGFER